MKKSLAAILFGALSTALLGYALFFTPSPDNEPAPKMELVTAPESADSVLALTLPDPAGVPQSLSQWKGKILVVNYWATWCPPCREEMPAFSRLHDRYADKGVQFVGISIDSVVKIREFQKEYPVSYPLLIAGDDVLQTSAGIGNPAQALPFTVIFDRAGKLHSSKLGRFSEAALEQQLKDLLGRK